MSVISQAKEEMRRANFAKEDFDRMVQILELFFDQWDSGGSVWAVSEALNRLIAGKCLTPLTGDDDEWMEVADGVFQNLRISSVFKDPRFFDGEKAYDIDNSERDENGSWVAIEFPYYPKETKVSSPVIEI